MTKETKLVLLDRIPSPLLISLATVIFITGGLIYVIFRTKTLYMFSWFNYLNLGNIVDFLRLNYGTSQINEIIKFCLPDGLWLFSYLLTIKAIHKTDKDVITIIFYVSLPVIAIGSEVLQFLNLIPGVFDIYDFTCYICAIILFYSLNTIKL